MASEPNIKVVESEEDRIGRRRGLTADLIAPRRVFKRKRRTGLILTLKIALPLIAVGCIAYVVIWKRDVPVVHPIDYVPGADQQKGTDVTVRKVQYNGVDTHNRPYSITAETAVQPQAAAPPPAASDSDGDDDPNPKKQVAAAPAPSSKVPAADNVINLHKPLADMTMTDGAWVAVQADSGVYHRDAATVDLSGNVTLFHDTGLSFQTDAATVDLRNDLARGDQPVEGQNADGTLAAEGFEVRDQGQTVLFTGRAYLKLYPKKSNGGGS